METVIAYQRDGGSPFCEIVLGNGDRILIRFSNAGALIERLPGPGTTRELLFRGSPDDVAWLCAAIDPSGADGSTNALDIILGMTARLGSADRIKSAFGGAAGTLSRLRERAG